jgi:hypothetical protein
LAGVKSGIHGSLAGREALASAYKMIHGWHRRGLIKSRMTLGVAPLFVVSPDYPAFSLRHPNLGDRIKDLDPDWDGRAEIVYQAPDSMMGGREM